MFLFLRSERVHVLETRDLMYSSFNCQYCSNIICLDPDLKIQSVSPWRHVSQINLGFHVQWQMPRQCHVLAGVYSHKRCVRRRSSSVPKSSWVSYCVSNCRSLYRHSLKIHCLGLSRHFQIRGRGDRDVDTHLFTNFSGGVLGRIEWLCKPKFI